MLRNRGTYEQFAVFVAVGELLAYKRDQRNTVGTYCGSEDRWFIGH